MVRVASFLFGDYASSLKKIPMDFSPLNFGRQTLLLKLDFLSDKRQKEIPTEDVVKKKITSLFLALFVCFLKMKTLINISFFECVLTP